MKALIQNFPHQVNEAIEIGSKFSCNAQVAFKNVLVSGLGGSGIGGTIVSQLVTQQLSIPFLVNKGYFLPNWVGKETLVIISSYSGNTEETLQVLEAALNANAFVVCVTSGGKVEQVANEHSLPMIKIPGGNPPRASLGYSFMQQLFILKELGLINGSVIEDIEKSNVYCMQNQASIKEQAMDLAQQLLGKMPIIYSEDVFEAVAIRFRQQINENSKMLCWHHAIPEMNHNELVGWKIPNNNLVPIFLRSSLEFNRNSQRIDLNKSIIEQYASSILEVHAVGASLAEQYIYLIHLTDWVSLYLAELQNIDPVEVNVIDFLKGELAKL